MTNFTRTQRINLHFYSLLKCGADPIALYGSPSNFRLSFDKMSDATIEVVNQDDAEHLAEIGLTLEDIARIYEI